MDLKDIMAISGLPGLYKVVANRTDGIIVEGLHDKAKKFVSSRQHMFTPLENITIYTTEDSVELKEVFSNMKKDEKSNTVPDVKKSDEATLRKYMKSVLANYDEEKVYASDIKKLIKWYVLLDEHKLISVIDPNAAKADEAASESKTEEAVASTEEVKEEKPKKKTTKKAAATETTEATEEAPKKKRASKKAE
ncbi:MAG: DUF5606 domain-containing protein [Bacteroidota bacterium]